MASIDIFEESIINETTINKNNSITFRKKDVMLAEIVKNVPSVAFAFGLR